MAKSKAAGEKTAGQDGASARSVESTSSQKRAPANARVVKSSPKTGSISRSEARSAVKAISGKH